MTVKPPIKGVDGVRSAFDQALLRSDLAGDALDDAPFDPPPQVERHGYSAGQWPGHPMDCLPPGCPVRPLGVQQLSHDTTLYFFVNSDGQLVSLMPRDLGKKALMSLFARFPNFIEWAWPRFSAKTFAINGVETDKALSCLIKACSDRGAFNMDVAVRGRGAWRDEDGGMIWNSGEWLYRLHQGRLRRFATGEVGGVFYCKSSCCLKPWDMPVDHTASPASDILRALDTWSWARPALDPVLLVGWLGVAFMGAAIDWRPSVFFSGDFGYGKSHLQNFLRDIMGDAKIKSGNASAASIYQMLGKDCVPVFLDEFESGRREEVVAAIVELMRISASGDELSRGSADGRAVQYQLRTSFVFSSVNIPPLENTDRSRLAILHLNKLDQKKIKGGNAFTVHDTWGAKLLRQMMQAYPDLGRFMDYWKNVLARVKFSSREQATYGTLMAMANILLGDVALEERGIHACDENAVGAYMAKQTAQEREVQIENWRECLERLLHSPIQAFRRGEINTVGGVIDKYRNGVSAIRYGQPVPEGEDFCTLKEARDLLMCAGLGFPDRGPRTGCLAVPLSRNVPALNKIFEKTKWQYGVWVHALRQAPNHIVVEVNAQVKINGANTRCLVVDLAALEAENETKNGEDG